MVARVGIEAQEVELGERLLVSTTTLEDKSG